MIEHTSDHRRPDADPRSTPVLIVAAVRDAGAQLADLLRLARIELRGNLRALATLAALFGGALLLVLVSLALLLIAVRDAVAVLIGSDMLAGVIVALPFLAAAAVLTLGAFRKARSRPIRAGASHRASGVVNGAAPPEASGRP